MRTLIAACMLLLVAGCSHAEPDKRLTPEAVDMLNTLSADMPKCSGIWIVGARLPKDYQGCESKKDVVEVAVSSCDIVTYEPAGHGYYAKLGGEIRDGGDNYADTPEYQALRVGC